MFIPTFIVRGVVVTFDGIQGVDCSFQGEKERAWTCGCNTSFRERAILPDNYYLSLCDENSRIYPSLILFEKPRYGCGKNYNFHFRPNRPLNTHTCNKTNIFPLSDFEA